MRWTEQLFSPRVSCQRWSLPPLVPTEDRATLMAAVIKSCPSSCGGVQGFSLIFLATPNASTVPDLPVWPQATERYHTPSALSVFYPSRCSFPNTDSDPEILKVQLYKRTASIIFYGTDFRAYEAPLPRLRHQTWALFHEESPMNNYILSHGPGIRLFNYTATFSRESDYPLTLQWLPSLDYLLTPVAVSLEEKNRLRREGLAPVLYMQSHCDVPSDRDRYIKELMKYIQVLYSQDRL